MKTAEAKISSSTVHPKKRGNEPFFSNQRQGIFFTKSNGVSQTFFRPTTIQAKLTIGQPNDKYEQEADAMADKVIQRMSVTDMTAKKEPAVQAKPIMATITPFVQTKCAACEQEEKIQEKKEEGGEEELKKIQRKPIFESNVEPPDDENNIQRKCTACENEKKLQTKSASSDAPTASSDIESSLNSSKGSGSPIPAATREQMEGSFGADFSNVHIHKDSSAVQMNNDLSAQAFTHGNDIYFNSGKYDTNSTEGKHLLAHELTHTVQQGGAKQRPFTGKVSDNSTSSFISRAIELTKQQKSDEKKVKEKVQKAIILLGKIGSKIGDASQKELLDQMLNIFNLITPKHIGTLDSNRGRISLGEVVKWFITFTKPGEMGRPYEYHIRFDMSHETEEEADAYFHETSNYGGAIVIKVNAVKSYSSEQLAEILVHEAVHMFSHMQRTVEERIGSKEATMIPEKAAAGILNTSSFSELRKTFTVHFSAIIGFLNKQDHRKFSLDKIPASMVDEWNRKLIEETIAYEYQSRIRHAVTRTKSKGPTITIGFEPLGFLRSYMTKHWLKDKEDQAAMTSKEGLGLLKAMTSDMLILHENVEAQVGPFK